MKILHIDSNNPILIDALNKAGFSNELDFSSSKQDIETKMHNYDGIVIRSRFKIDKTFIDAAPHLKFIARVGAGLESIDCAYAQSKNIALIAAPEGNRNAVGEQALGMLLSLFNKLNLADKSVKEANWEREKHRGYELEGKTIGLIGYGNMGKSFAKKLKGFDVKEVLFYDIQEAIADENARQVSLVEIQQKADVLSLHTPWTPLTDKMVNADFIQKFAKPFWLINTARGRSLVTIDLVNALKNQKILGAGLDVLEYEKLSFEKIDTKDIPEDLQYLFKADNVLLTPHIAGWTYESHQKLAQVIADKIIALSTK
ncbi:MAG TPA: 2-hydroxyacid dehydrogenase [Flavobacterium sp.]|nr:2-hydroxyacid dehydrogenase [Flavobacterium sp.]